MDTFKMAAMTTFHRQFHQGSVISNQISLKLVIVAQVNVP